MKLTDEVKDSINHFVQYTKIQMGIEKTIIVLFSFEDIERFNLCEPDKRFYNKILGWTTEHNGNRFLIINVRTHQSFNTIYRSIIHEMFHIKRPDVNSEYEMEKYTYRWLETKHNDFGFYYDEEFFKKW